MIMTSLQNTPKAPSRNLPTIWNLCVVVVHRAKRRLVIVHRDLCLFLCGRQLGREVVKPGGLFPARVRVEIGLVPGTRTTGSPGRDNG
jgi:hypothetical protein